MKWRLTQLESQFKQLQILAGKKKFNASMAFELLQCSTNWAMKTPILGADQFIELILIRDRNETWNEVDAGIQIKVI